MNVLHETFMTLFLPELKSAVLVVQQQTNSNAFIFFATLFRNIVVQLRVVNGHHFAARTRP